MNEIIQILSDWNQWWEQGSVSEYLTGHKRSYTQKIINMVNIREIKILTGVRRCGKSTLFYQVIDWLINKKGINPKQILLINFEDEAIMHYSLDEIMDAYFVHISKEQEVYLFLDEIQHVKNWEKWIRKKYDLKQGYNFFVTGSSTNLLKKEYATMLTGRNLTINIYPLSFKDILNYSDIDPESYMTWSTKTRNQSLKLLYEYIKSGGFPEIFFHHNTFARQILNQYFHDILYKDIVSRYQVNPGKIKDLAAFLMTNISNLTSFRSLRGNFGFGLNTLKEYINYMEEAFLLFQIYYFDYSLKTQMANPRKIYAIDNGLRNSVAFKFSTDTGRLIENIVCIELKQRGNEIWYYKDEKSREIDFVIKDEMAVYEVIQVSAEFQDKKTFKREIEALQSGMKTFNLNQGLIITLSRTPPHTPDNIKIIHLIDWLCK